MLSQQREHPAADVGLAELRLAGRLDPPAGLADQDRVQLLHVHVAPVQPGAVRDHHHGVPASPDVFQRLGQRGLLLALAGAHVVQPERPCHLVIPGRDVAVNVRGLVVLVLLSEWDAGTTGPPARPSLSPDP